ncbi:helix-turn-helix domain-containing protein [Lactococcus allomyrinae]|uniref:XRE family transcriptional regulator n=1 Tax=Lactococcus allomyrinae TaxID=2419773 RepID=A0A387BLA1_9LACT|nr:helix-turn-helix transcriptional regulator [Lactococcus allomyrinae]AYG01786.1 XRE family transcriptional regulator [Lactococcus allomyrinae]
MENEFDKIEPIIESIVLGKVIKEYRKASGWSQSKLADKLFFTKSTVCDWEKGRTEPNFETLTKLIKLLHIDVIKLFGLLSILSLLGDDLVEFLF